MSAGGPAGGPVRLLELDPDLAGGLEGERLRAATAASLVGVLRLPKGPWLPAHSPAEEGFGLLVLSGFLVRRLGRENRFGAELLGRGDLLRPWQTLGPYATHPFEPGWQAIEPAEIAVMDLAFARRLAPFPEVAARLVDRAILRSRHLAHELAVVQQRRVERRLEMLFWQMADRWGVRTRDGVRVEVPLTHALLAELVAARRPSVSTALSELAASGSITRARGAWLLSDAGPRPDAADAASAAAQP